MSRFPALKWTAIEPVFPPKPGRLAPSARPKYVHDSGVDFRSASVRAPGMDRAHGYRRSRPAPGFFLRRKSQLSWMFFLEFSFRQFDSETSGRFVDKAALSHYILRPSVPRWRNW